MYGTNPITKQDLGAADFGVVNIWRTIQGEGPHAGQPAVFIRLSGCGLRCWFCDTDFSERNRMQLNHVIAHVRDQALNLTDLVVITGGEPFLQPVGLLCAALQEHGFHPQIETAGTHWDPGLPAGVDIVCSPKTGKIHPQLERRCHHYKYVINAGEVDLFDGLPVFSTQSRGKHTNLYRVADPAATVWVQPMDVGDAYLNEKNLQLCVDLALTHGYRLCIQTHKIAGVE
jgi:organic radical activating enzyme